MKITFIKNHVSIYSGNSFYEAGTQADLRHGQKLIDLGVAYEGWEDTPLQGKPNTISLDDLSIEELRSLAKELKIRGAHLMKQETLIERLNASRTD